MHHTTTGGKKIVNGNSRKELSLALASFAVGAAVASILGNSQARGKLLDGSKKLADKLRTTE
jgi:hypothetical protein